MRIHLHLNPAIDRGYSDGGNCDAEVDIDYKTEAFRAEMLKQCANDNDIGGINAGTIEVQEFEEG